MKQLFKLKSKSPHSSRASYEGACVCNETYISETRQNAQIRWDEHEDPKEESEPMRHYHYLPWLFMEASMIALNRSTLNEKDQLHRLLLFRNGVT